MKPDKKYMSLTNDDIIFDTFEVESPFCDLNYGLTPIVNIESKTFRTLEPRNEEEDLRKSSIDKALGGNEELMCYNRDVYVDTSDNFEIPTPTEILRGLDLDLDEDELVRASLRQSQDFGEFGNNPMYNLNNLSDQQGSGSSNWGGQQDSGLNNFGGQQDSGLDNFGGQQSSDLNNFSGQQGSGSSNLGGQQGSGSSNQSVIPPIQPLRPQPGRPPIQPPRPPRPPRPCTGEFVFEQIRRNNPNILNTLSSFRVPPPIARTLIIRIANLTLQYCNCNTRE